jgi:hypothetical protein
MNAIIPWIVLSSAVCAAIAWTVRMRKKQARQRRLSRALVRFYVDSEGL